MRVSRSVLVALALLVSTSAAPAAAADKTHQQIMAEIRMLQEQQQQLQQMLGTLADTLKALTGKVDDQTGAVRKGFADQKLLVDNVAEGVRILREKADDTSVRLSTMAQELEAMRQTVASAGTGQTQQSAAPPTGVSSDPTGTVPTNPSPTPSVPAGVSPQRTYQSAFSDYTGGQYELAIKGFTFFIETFPTSVLADDAQLNICNSYYAMGNYKEAATACQKVVSDYAQADSVPTAYYKLGLSYEGLKQPELARRAYETLLKNYPSSIGDATLAKQRLDALNRK